MKHIRVLAAGCAVAVLGAGIFAGVQIHDLSSRVHKLEASSQVAGPAGKDGTDGTNGAPGLAGATGMRGPEGVPGPPALPDLSYISFGACVNANFSRLSAVNMYNNYSGPSLQNC